MFKLAKQSIYILKYGVIFCIVAMCLITIIYVFNNNFNYSYKTDILCKGATVTVFYVFAEVVIGALIFDILHRRKAM